MGARLESGVVLEAVRADWSHAPWGPVLRLELDWKLTQRPPRGVGIFIHLEPEGLARESYDHVLLSGTVPLDRAPLGQTLRDVVRLDAPPRFRGRKWRVYTGLWEVLGTGRRLAVEDPRGLPERENRLEVFSGEPPEDPTLTNRLRR